MSVTTSPLVRPQIAAETLLRRFLSAYWLRPENAFWMTNRSLALRQVELDGPVLDLACGDGIFSFLHAGGVFEDSFDVFEAVGQLDQVSRQHADMFDVPDASYAPPIANAACYPFDTGCDLKPNLLAKASMLHFYRDLVQHDSNQPLPFADNSFGAVYCNAIYWLDAVDAALAELGRITRSDGKIVLQVKLGDIDDFTLSKNAPQLGASALDVIGRGRRACWPTVATASTWEARFVAAGLTIENRSVVATGTHAQVWDIGLRPIAPLLVRMANGLTRENRSAIKQDWIELLLPLLTPLAQPDFNLGTETAQAVEYQYVLTP